MLFGEVLQVAFASLRANALRSVLTMLGIVIGVAAVIAMIALGTGAENAVKDRIAKLGTTVLQINPQRVNQGGVNTMNMAKLTTKDVAAIRDNAPVVDDYYAVAGALDVTDPDAWRVALSQFWENGIDCAVLSAWTRMKDAHTSTTRNATRAYAPRVKKLRFMRPRLLCRNCQPVGKEERVAASYMKLFIPGQELPTQKLPRVRFAFESTSPHGARRRLADVT